MNTGSQFVMEGVKNLVVGNKVRVFEKRLWVAVSSVHATTELAS